MGLGLVLQNLAGAAGSVAERATWLVDTFRKPRPSSQGSNNFQSSDFILKCGLIGKYSGVPCAHVSRIWAHFAFILFNLQ